MPDPISDRTPPADGPDGHDEFLLDVKGRIQAAQTRAALTLSREVVLLYWQIGREIRERQERHRWEQR